MPSGGITIDQAIDLGYATLQAFEQDAIEMTLKHQTYEVLNKWFKSDKKRLDGGKYVTFDVSLKDTGNGAHVRMYDTDTPNVANVTKEGSVDWTHYQNSFSYSLKEIAMNMGNKRRIFNLLKNRRANCARETADDLEEQAWQTPSGSSDDLVPHGIPAWLVQADADGSTGDFVGYVGDYTTSSDSESAYSDVAGIACTSATNTRWANYYADHDNNLDTTLLKKLSQAFRKTKFQTPMVASEAVDPKSGFSNFRLYTTNNMLNELEDLALKSDDRVGSELGKYAGAVTYKNLPLVYVDSLDTERTYVYGADPIFGVNHNHFYPMILSNENFRWNKPMNKVGQHNVFTVYLDLSYAYVCDNRRAGGFLISDWEGANQ